jgi:hypothetical protein
MDDDGGSRPLAPKIRAHTGMAFPGPCKGDALQELNTDATAHGLPDSADHL